MSGGGTGLMSGGGESMGSIGRGNSVGVGVPCGCSMPMPRLLQQACLEFQISEFRFQITNFRLRISERLTVEADGAHQGERVAVLADTGSHPVIEDHFAVLEPILEVHVDRGPQR